MCLNKACAHDPKEYLVCCLIVHSEAGLYAVPSNYHINYWHMQTVLVGCEKETTDCSAPVWYMITVLLLEFFHVVGTVLGYKAKGKHENEVVWCSQTPSASMLQWHQVRDRFYWRKNWGGRGSCYMRLIISSLCTPNSIDRDIPHSHLPCCLWDGSVSRYCN